MPALNFKKQFASSVESGVKRQTIRAKRKRPIKVGDRLYLYTGMRTKNCRKLKEVECKTVKDIKIYARDICINNKCLSSKAKHNLAKDDGFNSLDDFRFFFWLHPGFPFIGDLITW